MGALHVFLHPPARGVSSRLERTRQPHAGTDQIDDEPQQVAAIGLRARGQRERVADEPLRVRRLVLDAAAPVHRQGRPQPVDRLGDLA